MTMPAWLRVVLLELDPQNADAMRVIARSAERAGLRSAIEFWRRVNELSGNAEGDVTSWARCAIRFGDASAPVHEPRARHSFVIALKIERSTPEICRGSGCCSDRMCA